MSPGEYLRGQLERLFELDGMMALSSELLGVEPTELGGTSAKGTFAQALVRHCETHDELAVLAEAIRLSANDQGIAEPLRATDEELAIGTEVRGARVLEQFERGPMATLYLVEQPADEGSRRAHLKVFRRELTRDRVAAFRLLSAARALRDVRDPGLAALLDAGTLPDGRVFLLTDAVRGQSLAERVRRAGKLSFSELRPIVRGWLRGLSALHARGHLHGYVSAEHVTIVRPPQPAESDERVLPQGVLEGLALAKLLEGDADPQPGVLRLVGDPRTLAPEVARGQRPTPQSEIYALGCVLYFALTGSHVYEAEAPIDQVLAHVMEPPLAPSQRAPEAVIGTELDAVIMRALSKQPEERFADVRELALALEAVPRSSVPPGPPRDISGVVEALRAAPSDVALALELESLVAPGEGALVAVAVYRELAAESDDEAIKKQLLFRAARLLRGEVGDDAGAADVYRELLAIDPADLAAHDALAELYRARGEHEAVIGVLLDRLDMESDSDKRAAILREVARHYDEGLEQRENALVAYTQALADDPEDTDTQRAIVRLAPTPDKLQDVLATLHERLHDGELDEPARLRLSVVVGGLCLDRLERPEAARPYLDEALAIAPDDTQALATLARLYTHTRDHAALLGVTLRQAALADNPAEKRAIKARAASLAQLHLGDLALAESLYGEVFAEDPSHLEAARALEEIYADTGDREKLLELLEQRLAAMHGPARAEALCELAMLYEDHTHTRARALYEEALEVHASCQPAFAGLAKIYSDEDDHAALRELLERELAVASGPQQRISLLERVGRLSEEVLHEPAAAAESFERIIALAPNHERANTALARLYRVLHRFEDLAETYERHAKGIDDDQRKVELMMLAARVWMADLAAPEQAAFMCERVLAVAPTHLEALALSARIKAHAGDTFAALDALEVLADTERDPGRRADLLVRAGQLLEAESNLDAAVERFGRALEASAGHADALDALERVHTRRGDVRGQATLLQHRAELAQQPAERAALFASLGRLRKDKLGDRGLALDAFRRACELDPDNRAARIGLGQLALEESRFDDAVPLLQPLLDQTIGVPDELALPLLKGLGIALRSMGQLQQAERAYLSARAIDRDDLTVVERLVEIALTEERFETAAGLLETLVSEPSEVDVDDAGEAGARGYAEQPHLWQQLGQARFRLGDLAGAAAALTTAQELDPEDADTLVALTEVQERQGDLEALASTLQRRLELPLDDTARVSLLMQAGDLASQRGEHAHAAALYGEALELGGDERNLLSKLMALHTQSCDWPRLIEVLVRMASVVDDRAIAAKYLATAGGIAQSELRDLQAASGYYDSALGHDPTLESAFRGLIAGLTAAGAWDWLASAYRAQIERLRDSGLPAAELAALWDALGAIYRERLHRMEPAIEAYEAASTLMPAETERLVQLVELYERLPSRFADSAIAAHDRLLAEDPGRVASYRALRRLYTQLQRPDEAWVLCQALRNLGAAEPEEEAFFRRHRVQAPATARECITEELWQRYVLFGEQDPLVTQMLALIQPAAVQELAHAPEVFGIARDGAIACASDGAVMARMLHYATGVLLVPLPPVFHRPKDPGGVSFLFTNPPALGLGQGAHRSAPDQALAFMAGRQLSYFRPGHYLRQLLPTGSGLRAWLLGAIRLVQPRFPIPEGMGGQVDRAQNALARTLHVPQQQALASLVEKLLRDQPELDLKRWALAVDLLADRAGFILANSLDAAVAVIRASPQDSSYASERERLQVLHQYAVSARYLALRKAIGVTIG